jgi:hypothetical protein
MSEREILTRWLGHAVRRLRLNLWLREASAMACWLLFVGAVYQLLRLARVVPEVLAALLPLFVLSALALVAWFAWRLMRRPTLEHAAAAADQRADLKDELGSALWFAQQSGRTPMVELLLERATQTVQRLEPERVFPVIVPRGLPVAGVLALLAGVLAGLSPRVGEPGVSLTTGGGANSKQSANRVRATDAAPSAPPTEREVATANREIDRLVRELASDSSPEAIAQAIGARDPKSALQLMEAIRRRQAAAQQAALPVREMADQMSEPLAQSILERLKELSAEEGGIPQEPPPLEDAQQTTERLQRELREEMAEAQRSRPGEQSQREQELNTAMRGISRNSTGGRELVRGETEPIGDAGRTSVGGGGSMGRRIGVSQAGGGEGEQPRSNPEGNPEADPVFGKKTQRLAVQLQTIKVDQAPDEDRNGAEEAFYAATQSQASKLDYEAVSAHQRYATEQQPGRERIPMAYRGAVKQYMMGEHGREPQSAKGREE